MRKKWTCPNCAMCSDRPWNVRRHIQRRHEGRVKPVSHDMIHSLRDNL